MLRATLYIIVCSARNRTWRRLQRLREPRYLVGATAGFGYLIFTLVLRQRAYEVRTAFQRGGRQAAAGTFFGLAGPVALGVLLAFAALVSWVLPFGSGLLEFSRAESAFLFPSPLSRRQLVIYRLMRSQFAVFTGALIMALAYPTGTLVSRVQNLVGIWIVLMVSHVFFTGVTLARDRIRRGGGVPPFVWPAMAWPALAVSSIVVPLVWRAADRPIETVSDALDAVMAIASRGGAALLLSPFTLLARPLFAVSLRDFASGLAGALVVYAVLVVWLLWADEVCADAADASAERQASLPSRRSRAYVARQVRWSPRPGARPEWLFVWKNVLQTFRTVDRRLLLRLFLIVGWMVAASVLVTRARGLVALVGIFSTWGGLFTIFMAPQIIRMDLRQDLAHLEFLKTWPVRGAAVLRGEIVWSATVVTTIAWVFGVLAMVLSMVSGSRIPSANRLSAWTSFLILTPAIVLAQYTMHNAVAVLFPGWVPLGASRPRGVDAAGQRLILLVANWIGLLVALLPGIALTIGLSLLLRPMLGPVVLPIGALLTTMIVIGEAWLVTEALGSVFERLDVTSVERPD